MPARKIDGTASPIWTPYQEGYPLAPETEIRILPWYDGNSMVGKEHILTMHPVPPLGQWSRQAAWIDGEWRECFYSSKSVVWGYEVYRNHGVKPDVTLGDFFWAFPEASLTWQ